MEDNVCPAKWIVKDGTRNKWNTKPILLDGLGQYFFGGQVSFSQKDFEEQNQVLGQVDNHSKLIPEALVVSEEMFTTKPEFQQHKAVHGFDGVQPVQFVARYGESV